MFAGRGLIQKLTFLRNRTTRMSSTLTAAASAPKRVGTHNGSFHCDEALGCFMIRLTNKFLNAEIVRSRDPKVLETLDAVLDVGGVYDPARDRYDHHQKGFNEVFGHGFSTKLSSAGLVYKVQSYLLLSWAQDIKLNVESLSSFINNFHLSCCSLLSSCLCASKTCVR